MNLTLQSVRYSLFLRLVVIFGITVFFFFLIISLSLRTINKNVNAIESIPDFFARNVESIIEDIGTPPNLQNALRLANELEWSITISNPIMRWSSDGDNRLDLNNSLYVRRLSNDAEMHAVNGEDIIQVEREGYVFYLYQRNSEPNNANYIVLYIGLALAAMALFFNYLMVNRLLDPIRKLRFGAERLTSGDLSFRVETGRQDELGELTESINHMADSLQSMLEAKRQLLLAISHELRTPLTKAKLRLEFIPDSKEKEELNKDISEIDHLIADLIEAERLNDEHVVLTKENTLIAEFVGSVINYYSDYKGGIKTSFPKSDSIVLIDKLRIRLLITNLMNNAMRHGRNKTIEVKILSLPEQVFIEIIDHGEGIAEEHLKNISEPFYRADSARQRITGGFGLGLYLCRLIAKAHGSALNIESEENIGTKISIALPKMAADDY
ncbi:HAMP domain-containing histidine kinase [OM182 bacterium]|nr:HAMP domain-containing histidine kinase [OM182 bacterium]